MQKCDCYELDERFRYNLAFGWGHTETYGRCNGTRERDECSCGGDKTKCSFYPEVREKAIRAESLIYIAPPSENYIEILGHKIDGFDSFEAFCEHLNRYAQLEAELARVTEERDAAVRDLDICRHTPQSKCFACKHDVFDYDKSVCTGCDYNDNWEWRGVET